MSWKRHDGSSQRPICNSSLIHPPLLPIHHTHRAVCSGRSSTGTGRIQQQGQYRIPAPMNPPTAQFRRIYINLQWNARANPAAAAIPNPIVFIRETVSVRCVECNLKSITLLLKFRPHCTTPYPQPTHSYHHQPTPNSAPLAHSAMSSLITGLYQCITRIFSHVNTLVIVLPDNQSSPLPRGSSDQFAFTIVDTSSQRSLPGMTPGWPPSVEMKSGTWLKSRIMCR